MSAVSVTEAVGRGMDEVFGDLGEGWTLLWDAEIVTTYAPCLDPQCTESEPVDDDDENSARIHSRQGVLVRVILMGVEGDQHRMDFVMDPSAVAQDRVAEAIVRVRTEAEFVEQTSSLSDVAEEMQRIVQENKG